MEWDLPSVPKKSRKSKIYFRAKTFFELFLHLRGKEVNEELGVAVLDRDFHNLFSPVNDLYDAIELSDVEILSIK